MTPKSKKLVGAFGFLVILALAALVIRVPSGPTAKEMQAQIEKTLPVGSSRELVAQFAKNQGMEHSEYIASERMINAIRRGVSKGLLSETSIYVRFYFNDKQTLQRFTVEEVTTGL